MTLYAKGAIIIMQTQSQWIDLYKLHTNLRSDYKLAKHWQVEPSRICQYRANRLRLTLAQCLQIADALGIEPLEVITSVEYRRVRELDKEQVKTAYFDALLKTVGNRMSANGIYNGYKHLSK